MLRKSKTKYPKTHSDILWHFTGGALWNKKRQAQSIRLKSTAKAFKVFIEILKSQTLYVGNYHEIINCTVPQDKFFNKRTKRMEIKKNITRTVPTSRVCCVADIPLSELFHHAKRYGKIAIGFKRSSLIKAGFNPVFYTLHDTEIILNFYNAQNALQQSNCGIESSLLEIECGHSCNNNSCEPDESYCSNNIDTSDISIAADEMNRYADEALNNLENTLAFIKTFSRSEFNTIYSEREWRSTKSFKFHWNDVAALILPSSGGFYEKFVTKIYKPLKIPRIIKLYRWEEIL